MKQKRQYNEKRGSERENSIDAGYDGFKQVF
jgi:hypothetical protein